MTKHMTASTLADRHFNYPDFQTMYLDLARQFLTGGNGNLIDVTETHVVKSYGVTIEIEDPTPTMDFYIFGYSPLRWGKFGSRYLDNWFFRWLDQVGPQSKHNQHGYMFRQDDDHTHGNCITSISYTHTGRNTRPEITLQSRTAYLMPTSALELSLAGLVAVHHQKKYGVLPRLRWQIAQLQFTTLFGFPWLMYNMPKLQDIWDDGTLLPRHASNHTRHLRVFDDQISGRYTSPYKKQERLMRLANQVLTETWTPFIPTDFPIIRMYRALDNAKLYPPTDETRWDTLSNSEEDGGPDED